MTSADHTLKVPAAASGRALVVVAHAHAGTCELLFRQLSPGHEVHLASDGFQALALVRALVPALLLADVDLPGLDGAALRRALRDDVSLAAVGVMLMAVGTGALGAGSADGEAPLDPGCGTPELLARVGGAVVLAQARREAADREAALRAETVGVLEALKDGFVAFDAEFRYRYVNAEAERLMGQDRAALLGRSTWEVYPDLADSLMEAAYREALRERKPLRFTNHYQPWDRYFEINAHPAPGGGLNCYFRDVSQERREAILLSSQKRALELAVGGAELGEVLGVLVGACEAQAGHGAIASIMLCDAQREHLHIVAAPRLPAGYRRAIDGMRIGQDRGSCGTAAHTARSIIVTDVRNAPIWKDYRAAALADGLMACWSTPILSSTRQVVGTLAVYYPSVRNPSPQDRTAVQLIERSAALIIERATEVRERREAEAHLRDEVRLNGVLNRISSELAAQLEPQTIVRTVIDGAVALTGAALGAFIERDGGLGELRGTLTTGAWREIVDASLHGSSRPAALPDRGTEHGAAQRLDAVQRLAAIGTRLGDGTAVLRVDDAAVDARFMLREAAGAGRVPAKDAVGIAADGPLRAVLAVPVVLSNGSVAGELLLAHDQVAAFSARHETLAVGVAAQAAIAIDNARLVDRLRESAERFELAMSAADMGWWIWNAESGDYRLSERAGEIFEWDASQPFPLEQARQWIHPEDASAVFDRLAVAKREGDRFDIDHRYVRRDGSIGWVSVCALVQRDADGRAQRMFGILQDITTRKSMESELRRRADALSETDRRKDEFLATLAHELRNPLAPLRTSLELLKRPNSTEAMREQARSIMSRQVTQMVRLIDELIDIARINSGKIELRRQPLPLHEAIEAALEIARPGIEASGHTLVVDLTPEVLTLEVDATRIAQVLSNLLNNAARYTQPGGRIDVRSARRGRLVEVTVSDNGIGIPNDMLERVFEMFTQGDAASPRAQGGLGVGLALARKLVELHGGTLRARSDGPSKGSAFVVTLPLAHDDNAAAPPAVSGTQPPAAAGPADDAGLRVLIVDDNIDAAESMALVLADEGHAVSLAHDGPQGLERATSTQHDVALLDIGLPGFDGCELARRLRAHPRGRGMLLIATTGWGQARDRERSSEAGFDHHLVKPLDPELVRSLIASRQQALRAAAGPRALNAPNDRTPVTLSPAPSSAPSSAPFAATPAATSGATSLAFPPSTSPTPPMASLDGAADGHADRLAEQLQTVAPPALPLAALAAPTGPASAEGPADGDAGDGAPRARVLVVDDSELVLESAAAIIESEGYEVRTASDGVEALDLVRGWKPDVVLLDMHMRTMGGIETAKRLRAEHPFGTMALLMMSGVTLSDAWIEQARATGFDDCIDKTADPDVWLAHLARWTAPRAA